MKYIFLIFILFSVFCMSANVENKIKKVTEVNEKNHSKELDNFWKWFSKNEKRIYEEYTKNIEDVNKIYSILSEIREHLQKFSQGLHLEIGNNAKPLKLIITPQGMRKYFADAFIAAKYAPNLEYWNVQATKSKSNLKNFFIVKGDIKINNENLFFVPIEDANHPDEVIIKIVHPNYDENSSTKGYFQESVFNILDETLGEINASFDIDYVEFASNTEKTEKKFSISKLEEYLQSVKSNRKFYNKEFLPDDITMMKGDKDGMPSSLLVNLNYKHYSFTQKYPYLVKAVIKFNKITKHGWPEDLDAIHDIDSLIIDTVTKNRSGHYIYSEMYNGKRSVCMYVKDKKSLEKSINQLKDKITTHKIEYKVLYDPFWVETEHYLSY